MARKRSSAELGLEARESSQKKRHSSVDESEDRELSYEGKSSNPLRLPNSTNPAETANMSSKRKAFTIENPEDTHAHHQKRIRLEREITPEYTSNKGTKLLLRPLSFLANPPKGSSGPTKRKAPLEHSGGHKESRKKPRVEEKIDNSVLRNENAGEAEAVEQTAIEKQATEDDAEKRQTDENDQTGIDPKAGRASILWEQLKDIVFLKENFVADPSDPKGTRSLTTGPRTNQQLVDEYNKLWGANGTKTAGPKDVVPEACMKRYRRDKADVYTAFPNHPQTIEYADKDGNRASSSRSTISKTLSKSGAKTSNVSGLSGVVAVASTSVEMEGNRIQNTISSDPSQSAIIQRQADDSQGLSANEIGRDFDSKTDGEEEEDQDATANWVRLIVLNGKDKPDGDIVAIRDTHLRSSRIYRDDFDTQARAEITIRGFKLDIVRKYADCISPKLLSSLPEFDFSLKFARGEAGWMTVPDVKRIEWTLENTISLYELASLLEDDHVRNLVIDHWNKTIPGFVWDPTDGPRDEFEDSMELVFDLEARLPKDRLLHRFWKRKMSGGPRPYHNEDGEEKYFHRRYHHHEVQTRCHLEKAGLFTQKDYKATHCDSLAQRLLLSKPLPEKAMKNGYGKVGNALFGCLEWARKNL